MEWDGVAAGLAFLNGGMIIAVGYIYKALRRGQTLPKSRSLADVLKSIITRLEESREDEDVQKLREKISKIKKMVDEGTEASIIVEVIASVLEDSLSLALLLLEERRALRTEIDEFKTSHQEEIQAVRTELKTSHQEEMQAMRTDNDNKFAASETSHREEIQAVRTEIKTSHQEEMQAMRTDNDNKFAAMQGHIDRLSENSQSRADTVKMAEFNRHLQNVLASRLGEIYFNIKTIMRQEKGGHQTQPKEVWNAPMHKKVNEELNKLSKLAGDPEMEAWSEGSWDSLTEFQRNRHDKCHNFRIRRMSGNDLRTKAAKVLATLDSKEGAERYKGIAKYHPMLKRGLRILTLKRGRRILTHLA